MNQEILATRCGIYCGACYIYRAQIDGGDFLLEIADWQKVSPFEVKCNGCLAPDNEKWLNCRICKTQRCLKEKELNYCYECNEFSNQSCSFYEELEEFCARRGENIRENMIKIRDNVSQWLLDQENKWRCPSCEKPYSWYEKICHHCGNNLD